MPLTPARAVAACLTLALAGCATSLPNEFDLGALASRGTTVDGRTRTRALGPVFEHSESPDGTTFTAIRPLYNRLDEGARDRTVTECLWPLAMKKDFNRETMWRFLFAYANDFDNTDPESRFRFVVFPVFFTGRDSHGEDYFGIFPLGGKVNEYIGKDKMRFVLFPLYMYAEASGIRSHSVLWPVFARADGGDFFAHRVFPFYGKAVNEGAWTKKFVMWPFWTSVQYHYPKGRGGGFIAFPFFGHVKTLDQEMWTVLPPLFQWGGGQEGTEKKVTLPYPFFQYRRGVINKFYLWPLYGRKSSPRMTRSFALWPMVRWRTRERREYQVKRIRVVPFLYAETRRDRLESGEAEDEPYARYVKVWPIGSYRRDRERKTVRALELWPYANVASVRKNFMPFWTLYTRETSGHMVEDEVLWGLFRYRRDGTGNKRVSMPPLYSYSRSADTGASEWSVLCGLASGRTDGLRRTGRLLYFLNLGGERDGAGSTEAGVSPASERPALSELRGTE